MTRTEVIRARCTESERVALLRVAQAEQRHPSEMLRELVRQAARDRGLWAVTVQQVARGRVQ
jgi:hypothetical protein